MSAFREAWTHNDAVRIHYLEQGHREKDRPSFLVSAGIWEPAERALPLFGRLHWHHCVSFSYRGRGKSDTPTTGYDLEDHLGDLEAVVRAASIDKVVLLAFSRGVGCALQFALNHPDRMVGLILVDQPPMQNKWAPGSSEFWKSLVYLGRPLTDFIRPTCIDGLEREARQVLFWDRLPEIRCPVLILRGLKTDHPIPPDLSEADGRRYLSLLPKAREIGFHHSGHMIPDNEPDTYAQVVQTFLDEQRGAS